MTVVFISLLIKSLMMGIDLDTIFLFFSFFAPQLSDFVRTKTKNNYQRFYDFRLFGMDLIAPLCFS